MAKAYKESYDKFMEMYNSTPMGGEEIGRNIASMAQYFADANIAYGEAIIKANQVASMYEGTMDQVTQKTISSSKAKVLSEASPEYGEYIRTKIDVENIEQMINALKSLQRGAMSEMGNITT